LHNRAEIRNVVLICVVLAVATLAAFWPVINAEFIDFDDLYIMENPRMQRGLTAENVSWAFTSFYGSNWHPLTWLSLLMDCELFGVDAPAMHRVNLGFHVANGVLLFLMLNRLTRAVWASAIVAALFALHPLRVESVAWITERKDVLSTCFWILTMWCYAEYVQRRCAGWYTGALLFFVLGLMSKAMLVTLPFVLLLWDLWPLRRMDVRTPRWWMDWARWRGLLLDKLPFVAFTVAVMSLTLLAPHGDEDLVSIVQLPLSERVENAFVSYARYLAKTFWPTDLAVFYPHPEQWPPLVFATAAAVVLIVTAFAVGTFKRWPWLSIGWFWFVGTLVPVSGIVQIGGQSMADRFTYVPSIGLFIAIVWTVRELVLGHRALMAFAVSAAAATIVASGVVTYRQAGYWKDSERLFTRAVSVTPPNAFILNSMGNVLARQGRIVEAMEKFNAALKLAPDDFRAWAYIGNIYARDGKFDAAIEHFRAALRHRPNSAQMHYNLGLALAAKGQWAEAITHFEKELALEPFYFSGHFHLGNAYLNSGNPEAAATNYLAAIQLKSDLPAAHYNLGEARLAQGRVQEAIEHFTAATRLDPKSADAHRQLGLALQQAARRQEALPYLERAVALNPSSSGLRALLAALLSELGQTQAAIFQYREALKIDENTPSILNNLAWLLSTHPDAAVRDGAEAVRLAERAVDRTNRKQPFLLGTLAAAYAEAGRFDDAVKTAEEAIQIAEQHGQKELAAKNRGLLGHYRERRAWREPLPKP
jgi:protein O-mannosyl-transferase